MFPLANKKVFIAALFFLVSSEAMGGLLPSFSEVKGAYRSSEGRLLDREGKLLQEQRLSMESRALGWVPYHEVSPAFRDALLYVEDKRFFEHHGVDLQAVAGAAWQRLVSGSRRGASTITMQLVKVLERERGAQVSRPSIWGKIRQARLAWALEEEWSKEQIFECYINLTGFRGELRGIAAASRALFGKDPHGLDQRESFLLVTLLRAPSMSAGAVAKRLCRYAEERSGLGDCSSLTQFAETSLGRARAPAFRVELAPHLARQLLTSSRSERRSTVSLPLQRMVQEAVRNQLVSLAGKNVRDAAVIVAHNRTGEVLAYVGGSGNLSLSPQVDMTRSRRQAGSTLKPFLYALAFEKQILKPGSWILDEPFEIGLDRGSYEPGNYDHSFHGPVTARVALASSLNVPAVRAVGLVGVDGFRDFLEQLGFQNLAEGDHYGPSLALGTADISLQDLVQAYMSLANGGKWKALKFLPGETTAGKRRVLAERTAGEISAILSDRSNRALTFGWDSILATPYPSAVKTGTSKDMRDNWCIGYSREYTVGVWVGNGSGEPMWQVSGISGAAPVWRSVMDRLHKGRVSRPLLYAAQAKQSPGSSPAFDRGKFGRILYPQQGAVLALDPDIPEQRQRVVFEAEGDGILLLDGKPLEDSLWKPTKGRHHLVLSARDGAKIDSLSFEVR